MSKLKELREAHGLKLRDIAKILKICPGTVGRMEKLGIKKPETAVHYAKAFPGHSWIELLEKPEEKEQQLIKINMPRTYVTTNPLLLGVFIWILVEICAVEKDGSCMYFM